MKFYVPNMNLKINIEERNSQNLAIYTYICMRIHTHIYINITNFLNAMHIFITDTQPVLFDGIYKPVHQKVS